MHFDDKVRILGGHVRTRRPSWHWAAAVTLAGFMAWVAGCSSRVPVASAPQARPAPVPAAAPARATGERAPASVASSASPARSWEEYRFNAAKKLVTANPDGTYMGVPPEPLLAIPVLEITVRADGSIDRIDVLRVPTQAQDTVEMAKQAVRRAAPFGDVSRLPKPWKFRETFLYDDDRRFKPATLDR